MKTSVLTFPPHFPPPPKKKNSYNTDARFPGMPEVPEEFPESFSTKKSGKSPETMIFLRKKTTFIKTLSGTSVHCIS